MLILKKLGIRDEFGLSRLCSDFDAMLGCLQIEADKSCRCCLIHEALLIFLVCIVAESDADISSTGATRFVCKAILVGNSTQLTMFWRKNI